MLRFVQDRLEATGTDARIRFVFSNRERGEAEGSDEFFRLVDGYGLPLITHSSAAFRRRAGGRFSGHREEYDRQVMDLLSGSGDVPQPDICVLAGYMLIVGGEMCRRYPLLNLHPALPDGPTGTWEEVVWSLIEERASHTGAMMHLATEEVDRGPVVSYVRVPIIGGPFDALWDRLSGQDLERTRAQEGEELPLFRLIREEQYKREPYLLLETLRALGRREVLVIDAGGDAGPGGFRLVDPQGKPLAESMPNGLCLDQRIQEAMARDGVATAG